MNFAQICFSFKGRIGRGTWWLLQLLIVVIIVILENDNADTRVPSWLKAYPGQVINYRNNRGPAYARNRGAENPGMDCDWIYFTDCGCEHVSNLITHFRNAQEASGDAVVAVCGTVKGKGSGRINRYMTEMGILNPPFEQALGPRGEEIPQAIITANALVYAPALPSIRRVLNSVWRSGRRGFRFRDSAQGAR